MSSARVRVDVKFSLHCETSACRATMVLLVPSWTMTTAVFARQVEHFSCSPDDQLVINDPRTRVKSTKTARGHYSARNGRDPEALIDALDLECIVLGGWNCGPPEALASVSQCANQCGADRLVGGVAPAGTCQISYSVSVGPWRRSRSSYCGSDVRVSICTIFSRRFILVGPPRSLQRRPHRSQNASAAR